MNMPSGYRQRDQHSRSLGASARSDRPGLLRRRLGFEPLEQRQLLAVGAFPEVSEAVSLSGTGEIHGAKWEDADGNENWDAGELGVADWKIYLDQNQNNQWDDGEAYTTTASDGTYAFTALDAGTYYVAEVLQDTWQQTFPNTGTH